jgi:hypothetical protein
MQKICGHQLTDSDVEFILSDEIMFNKYLKFKTTKIILNNKSMKFCPTVNCDSFINKADNRFVECQNGHQVCFDCLNPWHKAKNCQEIIDKEFEKWRKGRLIKKCLRCGFWTEKSAGCNHMTCKACSFEWCWVCGNKYQRGHYERGGPCFGLQFSKLDLTLR